MNPISAFLAANRVYAELAAVALLAGAFALFVRHERAIGAAHEIAVVQKATAAQEAADHKDIDNATRSISELQARYAADLARTPVPDPAVRIRVCDGARVNDPPRQDAAAGSGSNAADGPPERVAGDGEGRDLTAPTEAILARSGATIAYLQGYIRSCQANGFCEKETSNARP